MRVWLELTQQEGERLFEAVKGFTVDRMQTAVVSDKNDKQDEGTESEENTASQKEDVENPIPIEKVRAVLAEKSQSGKQPQVKDLITKYGAKKLTDLDPAVFPQLLREAEEL
ncbi:DNA ligase [Desulfosporosinus sp.]|uniref:DNA ligase n=1 Tax=Desulfosporosinus sp. TaxID=157907 RepID=UPI0025C32048|nr:DNA ligase [Desulfosporosinus sp.]MBC2723230.1 hypothetical protein [Desulfosporosinus sp.]MBC2727105.1 hypothetical protein [Desulfosporosinus sp.]